MFQSVSAHSSEQSIAHYRSRPTVLLLKGISNTISTVNNAPFIQNSNRLASRLIATASFPSVLIQLLQFSRQRPSFSAHRAALMTKTDLTSPIFSLRFVDFAVQFCFRCKFSFHKKRCSSQVGQWRDFPEPITIFCYP